MALAADVTVAAQVLAGDGNDSLVGGAAADALDGEIGNDSIVGQDGADVLSGGDGNDTIDAGLGDDRVDGGFEIDSLTAGGGNDTVSGWDDNDTIFGGDGDDSIEGGPGDDSIEGGSGSDTMIGGAGNDVVDGQAGNDFVYGGFGHDSLSGGVGDDTVGSDQGNDTIFGGDGNDRLAGGGDNDWIDGGEGNDMLDGGPGADKLIGGNRDVPVGLRRGCDNDILRGGYDDDTLDGGRGVDLLAGQDGVNDITADRGRDIIERDRGIQNVRHIRKNDPPCTPGRAAAQNRGSKFRQFQRIRQELKREAAENPDTGPMRQPPAPAILAPAIRNHGGAHADLRIIQAGFTPTQPEYGSEITYTIKIKNAGPKAAQGVVFYDETSKSVLHYDARSNKADCTGIGTIVCGIDRLPDNDQVTVTLPGTVIDDNVNPISNFPLVQPGTPSDPNLIDNRTTINVPMPKADLELFITHVPDQPQPGSYFIYYLSVQNHSADVASDVQIEDPLPEKVQFFGSSPQCTYQSGVVTCNIGPVSAYTTTSGYSVTVFLPATTQGTIDNCATVSAPANTNPLNDRKCDVVNATPPPPLPPPPPPPPPPPTPGDLVIDKTCTPNPVVATNGVFDPVTCTLVAIMNGTLDTATNVRITDVLPRGVTFLSATSIDATGTPGPCFGTIRATCYVGLLRPGQSATATIVYRPTNAGSIVNSGCAVSDFVDPNTSNNCDTEPIKGVEVDLDISHSRTMETDNPGRPVPEAEEDTIGGFAVANLNDTNASGTADWKEDPVKKDGAAAPRFGRNEVDLMGLTITVTPRDFSGPVLIEVTSGDNGALWRTSRKEGKGQNGFGTQRVTLTVDELGKLPTPNVIWLEATKASEKLRDIVIRAYPNGAPDKGDDVHATGVWTKVGTNEPRFAHDDMTADNLLKLPDWTEMNPGAITYLKMVGGVGPLSSRVVPEISRNPGLFNGIAIRFTVTPDGIGKQPKVAFDISRQIEYRTLDYAGTNILRNKFVPFPLTEEQANDDPDNKDESNTVTHSNYFFVYDSPGFVYGAAGTEAIARLNAREFVRVAFDNQRPVANISKDVNPNNLNPRLGVEGSRASPYIPWLSRTRAIKVETAWMRDPPAPPENEQNRIEPLKPGTEFPSV